MFLVDLVVLVYKRTPKAGMNHMAEQKEVLILRRLFFSGGVGGCGAEKS